MFHNLWHSVLLKILWIVTLDEVNNGRDDREELQNVKIPIFIPSTNEIDA